MVPAEPVIDARLVGSVTAEGAPSDEQSALPSKASQADAAL